MVLSVRIPQGKSQAPVASVTCPSGGLHLTRHSSDEIEFGAVRVDAHPGTTCRHVVLVNVRTGCIAGFSANTRILERGAVANGLGQLASLYTCLCEVPHPPIKTRMGSLLLWLV